MPVRRLWRDSVLDAMERLAHGSPLGVVSRQQLIERELTTIVSETQSTGGTPAQTLSFELQQLRDAGLLQFVGGGQYRLSKQIVDAETFEGTQDELDSAIIDGSLRIGRIETGTALALKRRRIGQQRLRHAALKNYEGMCALCDMQDEAILVASHIVPWADSEDGRGDLTNVIILCRPHDSLFEFGHWSLDDEHGVLRHNQKDSPWVIQMLLPESIDFRLPRSHAPACGYLKVHRIRFGFNHVSG